MKRTLFNIIFLLSFIIFFSAIVKVYYADFQAALSEEPSLFSKSERLPLECQDWADVVRDFNIEEGEGAEKVPVLMYHRIIKEVDFGNIHFDEDGHIQTTIMPLGKFKEQMAFLKEKNYTTLTGIELQLFLENKLEVPKNSIVLTFDDGLDRKSTRLNSSHVRISYAVFCLK